jgi:hypothetical protein
MPSIVSDLWNNATHQWDENFIAQVFDNHATSKICNTQIVHSDKPDIPTWKLAAKGVCTAKEAFKFLNSQVQVQNSLQGPRGITDQARLIMKRTWKNKLLPPNIKAFTWRVIRRAIATGARAGNLSLSSSNNNNIAFCPKQVGVG